MTFVEAIKSVFSNYVGFSGRAPRSEYWFWILFQILALAIPYALMVMETNAGTFGIGTFLYFAAALVLFLPSLAVTVRRLHDIDRSGWWFLIAFVPLVGALLLIVWFCKKGTEGPNRFGADKLA